MTPLQILELTSEVDRLDFSQGLDINLIGGDGIGNVLFPNVKTQDAEAEFYRLANGSNIPVAGNVHALDTEAYIGSREDLEYGRLSPYFIKEKINQGENLRKTLRGFGNMSDARNSVIRYIFDDYARMAERVATRADVMKHEALATGTITVNENNINETIDLGVPANHRLTFTWSGAANTFDPWIDLRNAVRLARDGGGMVNTAIMSQAAYDVLLSHPSTRDMLFGSVGAGYVGDAQVDDLARRFAGIERIVVDEERYKAQNADVRDGQDKFMILRKFKEDSIALCYTNPNGAVGTGLWGVTPEEEQYRAFDNYSETGPFVTVTSWYTPDPVATWTKASGLFIPVLPGAQDSLIIATVALPVTP